MAEKLAALGFASVPIATQNYDKVWDPIQHKYRKARGKLPQEDQDIYDNQTMEEKGLVLRRRRDVGSDEEIVEVVRHKGQVLPRRPGRPGATRRSSSMDNGRGGAMVPYQRRNDSDSEGSVPPRSRVRAKSTSGRSRRRRSSSSSSVSSSDLGSSTDEEKEMKHMKRKKWLTAGLATVATIHAASKVYSSIEAHDKRIAEVKAGTLSPEDAHKKQRSTRWQDAAAIGVAALGIKGAISEWNELQEEHSHHKELMEQHTEQHKKRLERQRRRRARDRQGYYKGRDGQWYYNGPQPQSSESQRGGNIYDDRKMIMDSNREAKMITYEEEGGRRPSSRYDSQSKISNESRSPSPQPRGPGGRPSKFEKPGKTMRDLGVDVVDEALGQVI